MMMRPLPLLAMTFAMLLATSLMGSEIGKPAPRFSLKDLDGNAVKLADHEGKIVVLHFQSGNCPWDKAYQPILNRVAARHADKVVFLAINANADENPARIKQYMRTTPVGYTVLKDEGAAVADDYNARVTPQLFIIDAKQVLAYSGGIEKEPASPREAGQSREQYLEPVLEALLAGKKPPVTATKPTGSRILRK